MTAHATDERPCVEEVDVFDAVLERPKDMQAKADAKAVCDACPFQDACLMAALTLQPRPDGIWGGTTKEQRDNLRRKPRGRKRVKGVCLNGHDLNVPGSRYANGNCKQCSRDRQVIYRADRRNQRAARTAS